MSRRRDRKVSFDDEPLIIVNEADEVIGHLPKAAVHEGEGILHRAFSVFLLNSRGELLMQQRAATKPLWPLFWSNACCSHPRRGEQVAEAAVRRLEEELGVQAEPEYVYTFTYHARFGELGSERERCSVFLARSDDPLTANASEIAALRWMTPEALDWELRVQPDSYTPWLKLEWARLRTQLIGRCAPTHPGPD